MVENNLQNLLSISEREVFLTFGTRVASEGDAYQKDGRVLSAKLSPSGRALSGEVQGSVLSAYAVQIRTGTDGFKCSCSCSMVNLCKHSAALLFDLIRGGRVNRVAVRNALSAQEEQKGLYYILEPQANPPRLELKVVHASRTSSGDWGLIQKGDLTKVTQRSASYISQDDFEIARSFLAATRTASWLHRAAFPETGEISSRLLKRIVSTGRAYWKNLGSSPLRLGSAKNGSLEWKVKTSGKQQLSIVTGTRGDIALFVAEPWYINIKENTFGPLHLATSTGAVKAILNTPALNPDDAVKLHDALIKSGNSVPVPLKQISVKRVLVKPEVEVDFLMEDSGARQSETNPTEKTGKAVLRFNYGAVDFQNSNEKRVVKNNGVVIYLRDLKFEEQQMGNLTGSGLQRLESKEGDFVTSFSFAAASQTDWLKFKLQKSDALRANGWKLNFADSFEFNIAQVGSQSWSFEAGEGTDFWLSLDLGVEVDGKKIQLLPLIRSALRELKREGQENFMDALERANIDGFFYASLADGRQIALPFERVKDIVSCFVEVFASAGAMRGDGIPGGDGIADGGRISGAGSISGGDGVPGGVHHFDNQDLLGDPFDLPDALSLPQFINLSASLDRLVSLPGFKLNHKLQSLLQKVKEFKHVEKIVPPAQFNAELRPYQIDGLRWLNFLRDFSLGGILADDMGLGKTIQTLAHICVEKAEGRIDNPFLVVCPTSVLPNWKAEIEKFASHLEHVMLWGSDRAKAYPQISDADIVLTTYPLLSRDAEPLLARKWKAAILDEAQMIKNPDTQVAKTACKLKCDYRICLTGTPMENHLGELWSQFNFLMPGFLSGRAEFTQAFRIPIEKHQDSSQKQLLIQRIRPFLLRRTKDLVAKDLPEKNVIIKRIQLEGGQRDLYETIRVAMSERLNESLESKGLERSKIVILDALLKLRQVCCDSRLVKSESAKKVRESAKLEALMDMLEELQEEGRRVLLFSQFTSMLDLIGDELRKRQIDFVEIRGDTKDRLSPVQRFQNGEAFLFLLSLKAGGTGLNLTAADTVIHYDPWWNPAVENQASDRAHRIGQEKSVFVFKLIAAGTIEDRILELQSKKHALAEAILDEDGNLPFALSEEDVADLLKPIY